MTKIPFYAGNKTILISVYRHSSLLYVLSKIVKVCNSDRDIPEFFWIGDDNQTLCRRSIGTVHDVTITARFE